jgi:hypothetical protein
MDWLRDKDGKLGGDQLRAWKMMPIEGTALVRLQIVQRKDDGTSIPAGLQLVLSAELCRELATALVETADAIDAVG